MVDSIKTSINDDDLMELAKKGINALTPKSRERNMEGFKIKTKDL